MAIKVPFIADVSGFLRGTGDMEAALDDVAGALDDLARTDATGVEDDLQGIGRAADQAGQDVARLGEDLDQAGKATGLQRAEADLKELGAQADATGEKIERSFSEAFDKVKAEGRTATQRVKHDLKDAGDTGSATMREFKDEAKQNVAESLSSFTGSAESGIDAIQSTFGGLAASLGPAGIIGVSVAAAGIGLARGMFAKSKEAAQEVAQAVADLTGQLIDLGSLSLGSEQVNDRLKSWASTAEDGKVKLNELRKAAEDAGISATTFARGVAGDNAALQQSWDQVTSRLAELTASERDLMNTRGVSEQQIIDLVSSHRDERDALGKTRDELLKTDSTLDQSADTARFYAEAIRGAADASRDSAAAQAQAIMAGQGYLGVTTSQAEAAAAAADAIARKNAELEAEIAASLAAESAVIAYEQAVDNASEAIDKNGKATSVHTEKGRANRKALMDIAETTLALAKERETDTGKIAAYNRVIGKNREQFLDAAEAAGFTAEQARKLADRYGLIPKTVKTKVTDEGTAHDVQQKIDNIRSSGVPVPISPDMSDFDSSVKRYLNGKAYYVTVKARPGKNVHD